MKKRTTVTTKTVENEQRRAEPIEPEPLKFEDDGVEQIAENDTGGERGDCRAEQIDNQQQGRHSKAPEEDLAL